MGRREPPTRLRGVMSQPRKSQTHTKFHCKRSLEIGNATVERTQDKLHTVLSTEGGKGRTDRRNSNSRCSQTGCSDSLPVRESRDGRCNGLNWLTAFFNGTP